VAVLLEPVAETLIAWEAPRERAVVSPETSNELPEARMMLGEFAIDPEPERVSLLFTVVSPE
jgi:hypothetical protein